MTVHRFSALQQTGALNDFEVVDNFIYLECTINNDGQLWKGCLCFPYFFIALKHRPYMHPTRCLQSEVLDVLHTTNSPRYKCIYTKWTKITRHFDVSSLFYFCISISPRLREPWKTDCQEKGTGDLKWMDKIQQHTGQSILNHWEDIKIECNGQIQLTNCGKSWSSVTKKSQERDIH